MKAIEGYRYVPGIYKLSKLERKYFQDFMSSHTDEKITYINEFVTTVDRTWLKEHMADLFHHPDFPEILLDFLCDLIQNGPDAAHELKQFVIESLDRYSTSAKVCLANFYSSQKSNFTCEGYTSTQEN